MSEARRRLYHIEGIVIRRHDAGETDRVLTLYTPEQGKMRAVARGARRPGSRLAGHIELLCHSTFLVARGRNLDIVTQAQTIAAFPALRQDMERVGWGCYLAELLDRMAPEQAENLPAFRLLVEALEHLDQGRDPVLVARAFELHLMGAMGYRPQLFRCVSCEVELEPRPQVFSAAMGGVLCPRCQELDPRARPISLEALKVLRYIQRNSLAETERLQLGNGCRREIADLLQLYIRTILERDLNATGFLEALHGAGLSEPQEEP